MMTSSGAPGLSPMSDIVSRASSRSNCLSGFSIVVPTHGRVVHLRRLLASLSRARRTCPVATEVLVIDSSPAYEADRIESLCVDFDAIYISGPTSVRKKRNEGIRRARYSAVLFIDSDCEAHPELLVQHLRCYEEQPYLAGVLGRIVFTGPKNWMWEIVRFTPFVNPFSFASQWPYAIWGPTANISYKRQLLLEIGLFDENFPFRLGGDDVDLGLRVTKSGHLLRCNPEAIVYHSRETWTRGVGILSRALRWGRMEFHLLNKHRYLQQTDHPKLTILLSILLVGTGVLALITHHWWRWLSLPWIWLLLVWILEWIQNATAADTDRWHLGRLAAKVVVWCYELGFCFESILRRQPRMILKRPLFHLGQLYAEWPQRVRRIWSVIIATAILILLLPWLK